MKRENCRSPKDEDSRLGKCTKTAISESDFVSNRITFGSNVAQLSQMKIWGFKFAITLFIVEWQRRRLFQGRLRKPAYHGIY